MESSSFMKKIIISIFLILYILTILSINRFDLLGNIVGSISFLFVPIAFVIYFFFLFRKDLGIGNRMKILIVLSFIIEFVVFVYHINNYGDYDNATIKRLDLTVPYTLT